MSVETWTQHWEQQELEVMEEDMGMSRRGSRWGSGLQLHSSFEGLLRKTFNLEVTYDSKTLSRLCQVVKLSVYALPILMYV